MIQMAEMRRSAAENRQGQMRAALDDATAELTKWTTFLQAYYELAGKPSYAHSPSETADLNDEVHQNGANGQVIPLNRGILRMTENAAYEIIKARRAFVATKDLLKALEERGVPIGGANPIATLSSRLSRATSVENVRGSGWRLKEPRQTTEIAGPGDTGHPAAFGSNSAESAEGPTLVPAPYVKPDGPDNSAGG